MHPQAIIIDARNNEMTTQTAVQPSLASERWPSECVRPRTASTVATVEFNEG